MLGRPPRAARTLIAVIALTVALITFPRLVAPSSSVHGSAVPQETPPRTVGDVTRDGKISAGDALAVLAHIVGKSVPSHFILDPDGDAVCRGNVARIYHEGQEDEKPIHVVVGSPFITTVDALAILRSVVGKDVSETCLGYQQRPLQQALWEWTWDGTTEDYRTKPLVTVVGVSEWERVAVCDTLTQPMDAESCEWPAPPWSGDATQGLLRFGSSDPSVASIDTMWEWKAQAAGADILAWSAGEADLFARWFDSEDTVRIVVHPWEPAFITMSVRQIQRFGQPLVNQLVVGDTSRTWARAHDTLGFSKSLASDSVDFFSSDPGVLTVDGTGFITGIAPGSADVTAEWWSFPASRTLTVLSNEDAVEADIAASFLSWWKGNHKGGPGPLLSVAADQHTSSWGNFGMKDGSQEPRMAWNNNPSYGYASVTESPWYNLHTALLAAGEGLSAINGGLEIGSEGADTERARAFAKFVQGLSLGTLALVFDQAFTITESDLAPSQLSPYSDVMAAAVTSLQQAITIAGGNSFTTPHEWMGGAHTSGELVRIMHSYIARFMASLPRTPAERAAVNWTEVMSHIDQGITSDLTVESWDDWWFDYLKTYTTYSGWGRVDIRTLGPADQSGGYQWWMSVPLEERNEFFIDTDDRRVTGGAVDSDGMYFGYMGHSPFHASRGTYHFSFYGDIRYDEYTSDAIGDIQEMIVAEMDFLRAEGLYRTGDLAGAVAIINSYRTTNGQLEAATVAGVQGQDRCTPKLPDGSCGDLWETLKYDKRLEVFHASLGDQFFDDRGWGDLVENTFYHLPVPGETLIELGLPIYTFGGDQPLMENRIGVGQTLDPALLDRYFAGLRAWAAAQREAATQPREQHTPH